MKLEQLMEQTIVLFDTVPLGIEEEGIAYLNDRHIWVITLNEKHPSFTPGRVILQQILTVLEQNAHCYRNQQEVFGPEREAILKKLRAYDPETKIDLPLH